MVSAAKRGSSSTNSSSHVQGGGAAERLGQAAASIDSAPRSKADRQAHRR